MHAPPSLDIEFRSVTKRFGEVRTVDGIDLAVPRGAFVALLGPSGCGKTACLRMIEGFEQPTTGECASGASRGLWGASMRSPAASSSASRSTRSCAPTCRSSCRRAAFFVAGAQTTLPIYVFASIRRGVTPEINAIAAMVLVASVVQVILAQALLRERPK